MAKSEVFKTEIIFDLSSIDGALKKIQELRSSVLAAVKDINKSVSSIKGIKIEGAGLDVSEGVKKSVRQAKDTIEKEFKSVDLPDIFFDLESQIKALPNKSSPEFLKLQRQLSRLKTHVSKNFDDGILPEGTSEQLSDIGDQVASLSRGVQQSFGRVKLPPVFLGMEEQLKSLKSTSGPVLASIRDDLKRLKKEAAGEIEAGALTSETVTAIEQMRQKLGDLKINELDELEGQFKRVGETGKIASGNVVKGLGAVTKAIFTAGDSSSKLLDIREGFFGLNASSSVVARGLDSLTGRLDKVGKAESKLAKQAAAVAKTFGQMNDRLEAQSRIFTDVAKAEGTNITRLNQLRRQITAVENEYEKLQTAAEGGGKVSAQQLARVRNEAEKLKDNFKQVRAEEILGPRALKLLDEMEQSVDANTIGTRKLAVTMRDLSTDVEKARVEEKKLNTEVDESKDGYKGLVASIRDYIKSLGKAQEETKEMAQAIESVSSVADVAKGAFLGAFGGTLLGNIGNVKDALVSLGENVGSTIRSETLRIQGAFNLLPQEADIVSKVIAGTFANNFGNSVEEVGEATQTAIGRLRRLGITSGETIQGAVEDAFRLRDAYGFDVTETFDAVGVLIKNFGLTTQEAADFLAKLGQEGVVGPDVLDSITEYSVQVKNAGGNAATLFNLLETGFAGGGTLGTDRAIDLFKEFRVRIQDGSKATEDALRQIGINSEDLLNRMADGTTTATEAFEFILASLRQVDDQNVLMQAGVGLLGTQFEDLGQDAVLALSTIGTSIDDMAGSTKNIDIIYSSFGAAVSTVNRQFQVTLAGIQNALLGLASSAIPPVLEALKSLQPIFDDIAARITFVIDTIKGGDWETAGAFVQDTIATMIEFVAAQFEGLIAVGFEWGAGFMGQVAEGIASVIGDIIDMIIEVADSIAAFLAPGSPPEKGPLSDIDQWGEELIGIFGEGFASADFKFMDKALAPVQKFFKDEFGKGGFKLFRGVQKEFVGIINELNKTGNVNEDAFAKITEAIGDSNEEMVKLLRLQLDFQKAQKNLANVQNEVAEAERAGFVPKELRDKLKNAEQQVEQAKESVSFQEELLKFQSLSEDQFKKTGTAASAAGKSAIAGARAGTKAVRNALSRQRQFVQEGFEFEKKLLEDKLAKGVISEEQFLKGLIKLEEKYIDSSQRTGLLSGIDAHVTNLQFLKDQLGALKDAGKGGFAEGDSIIDSLIGPIAKGEGDALTLADDLGTNFAETFIAGAGAGAKARIQEAAGSIKDSVLSAFGNIVASIKVFVNENVSSEAMGILAAIFGGAAAIAASPIISRLKTLFGPVLKFIAGRGGIGGILKVIASLSLRFFFIGALVVGVFKNWDKIVAVLGPTMTRLTSAFLGFIETVIKIGQTILADPNFKAGIDSLTGALGNFLEGLETLATAALRVFTDNVIAPLADVIESLLNVGERFVELSGGAEGLGAKISVVFGEVSELALKISEAFSEITKLISSGDFSEIPKIISGLFGDIDLAETSQVISELFSNLGTAAIEAFASAIGEENFAKIQAAFSGFFKEGALGGELVLLFQDLKNLFVSLLPALNALWSIMKVGATLMGGAFAITANIVVSILQSLIDVIPFVLDAFAGIIRTVRGVVQALTGAVDVITGVVQAIIALFTGGDLTASQDKIREGFAKMGEGIVNVFSGILQTVESSLAAIFTFVISFFANFINNITRFGNDVQQQFGQSMIETKDNVIGKLTELSDDFIELLLGLRDQFVEILSLLITEGPEIIARLTIAIMARVAEMIKGVNDRMIEMKVEFIRILLNLGIEAGERVRELVDDVISGVAEIPRKIGELAGAFLQAGANLIGALRDGMIGAFSEIGDFFTSGAQGLLDGVRDQGEGIVDTFRGVQDELVTNSIIPETTAAIVQSFTMMNQPIIDSAIFLTTSLQLIYQQLGFSWSQMILGMTNAFAFIFVPQITQAIQALVAQWQNSIANFVSAWTTMATSIVDQWIAAMEMIIESTAETTEILKELFKSFREEEIDPTIEAIDEATEKIKKLGDIDKDTFANLYSALRKVIKLLERVRAVAKSAAAAVSSAAGPGRGGGAGFQRGVFNLSRNTQAFLHEGETVLPATIASAFRDFIGALSSHGIGNTRFNLPSRGLGQAAGTATGGPTNVFITAEFPNVTSANEADQIADALNELIDRSKHFATIGT